MSPGAFGSRLLSAVAADVALYTSGWRKDLSVLGQTPILPVVTLLAGLTQLGDLITTLIALHLNLQETNPIYLLLMDGYGIAGLVVFKLATIGFAVGTMVRLGGRRALTVGIVVSLMGLAVTLWNCHFLVLPLPAS